MFFPPVEEMYPPGFATRVLLLGPAAVGLDDRFRPTHFEGVATICCKLFTQSRADFAVFGEKDYQQLKVVTRMAADLDLGIDDRAAGDGPRGRRPRAVVAQPLPLGRRIARSRRCCTR